MTLSMLEGRVILGLCIIYIQQPYMYTHTILPLSRYLLPEPSTFDLAYVSLINFKDHIFRGLLKGKG